jgi:dipeptidase D
MNSELLNLKPERLWFYFSEILKIPRPSKKEGKIVKYLFDFGKTRNLETIQDETGNVLIRKRASIGKEHLKTVVLQSHVDMVCEKNSDKVHDFDKDPIEAWIGDSWVKARGTTLGADDGIGIAAQLAILESTNIQHGPLECLFTIDEETGLTGAFGLRSGFLNGKILLNLDSEDEGELFIGCAGGKDTTIKMSYSKEKTPDGSSAFKIAISGLVGGHSGDDIHKGRANANKLLNRILWHSSSNFNLRLSAFNGGNLRNAIAREAEAVVCIPTENEKAFTDYINIFYNNVRLEFKITEPELKIAIAKSSVPQFVFDTDSQQNLINSIYACPHGVMAWSAEIPGFVETSTNIASVKTLEDHVVIGTSQRSSVESSKDDICNMVTSVFRLTGSIIEQSHGYPGWTPNPNSEIVDITRKTYHEIFNENPKVLAIHAGLECGLIGNVYPEMEMISFGPTIKGAHSPDERLHIESVKKFWDLTLGVLNKIPADN